MMMCMSDKGNSSLLKFKEGRLMKVVEREGTQPGEFKTLGMIKIINDKLYVCDRGNHRFQILNTELEYVQDVLFYVATVSWRRCMRSVEEERVWWSSLISAIRTGSFKQACKDTIDRQMPDTTGSHPFPISCVSELHELCFTVGELGMHPVDLVSDHTHTQLHLQPTLPHQDLTLTLN